MDDRELSPRPELIVDQQNAWLGDPAGNVIGWDGQVSSTFDSPNQNLSTLSPGRMVFAMPSAGTRGFGGSGSLSRRYPTHAPLDSGLYGMDFSYLLPQGVGIYPLWLDTSASVVPGLTQTLGVVALPTPRLEIWTNTPGNVVRADADWFVNPAPGVAGTGVIVQDRTVKAVVIGGRPGMDYQFRWIIFDTLGNLWHRTGLLLVAQTS